MLNAFETAIAFNLISSKVNGDHKYTEAQAEVIVLNAVMLARVFSRLADSNPGETKQ